MAIVVDIEGIGPTEFENEEQANNYFKSRSSRISEPTSYLAGLLKNGQAFPPLERTRLSVGNPDGVIDYLKKQGVPAEYRDGELYIGQGNNAYPLDPNGLRTLAEAIPPIGAYLRGKDLIQGTSDQSNRRRMQDFLDIPSDLAEAGPEALNMLLTTLGGAAGTVGGSIAGPVGAAGGMLAGSAAGAGAAEKAKEGIGGPLGVYKTNGEYLTPEAIQSAELGAQSASIPIAFQAGKGAIRGAANLLDRAKIPQRLYASATGLSGGGALGKEVSKNPQIIDRLLREGAIGDETTLANLSDDQMKIIGDSLKQMLAGKDASYDEIAGRLGNFEQQFASGNRDGAQNAMDAVLSEFKKMFSPVDDHQILGASAGSGKMSLSNLNFEKSKLARAGRRGYENPDVNISSKAGAQKDLADAIRPIIEEKAPDVRGELSRYHAYDVLNSGLENKLQKDTAKKLSIGEVPMELVSTAFGGAKNQTKAASFLYKLLNKGKGLSSFQSMPKTQGAILELLRQGVGQSESNQ